MSTFSLPDLGEGLQDAEILTWHVGEGDHVSADQPLLSVETDKAVVDVPAPFAGTIARLHAAVGDIVAIGAPLVEIDTAPSRDTGAIVGDLTPRPAAVPESGPPSAPVAARKPTPAPETATATAATQSPAHRERPLASPAVRRLARERHIDLADVTGSGPDGAILSQDLGRAGSAGVTAVAGSPLRGVRRTMAKAMTRAHASVVPATLTDWADIDAWSRDDAPMTRLVQAIVVACRAEPALNAWFDGERVDRREAIDIGIAVDTPEGLFAPVLRSADTVDDIGAAIAALRESVRARTIAPDALTRATITLSNFGMLGGVHASLVVSPPQVAILGAGRIAPGCVIVDGRPVARRLLPLSLSFDHRVVTGGEAARFMAAVRDELQRARSTGGTS